MFKVVSDRLKRSTVHDLNGLVAAIAGCYHWNGKLPLSIIPTESVADWKTWMQPCLVGLQRHTEPHVFKLKKDESGNTRMWFRKTVCHADWQPGPEGTAILKGIPADELLWTSSVAMKKADKVCSLFGHLVCSACVLKIDTG